MAFTSGSFILFLCIVIATYVLLPQRTKHVFLLIASLVFYGLYALWAPVFIALFALMYFMAAKRLRDAQGARPTIVWISILSTIALYGLLRYTNLPGTIIAALSNPAGISISIVFPLGFSYYMFKCISYLVDVYNERIKPEPRFDRFLLYVAYFPEISLGPITRAADFLPQVTGEKPFSDEAMRGGFFMILWGFFKKLIFADRLATLIAPFYASVSTLNSGLGWLVVCLSYFIQLYLDFSAYTDISVGISKMLGYEVRHNFNAPLVSQTISEYWRRWHMSLSFWLLDYVFSPLQFRWRRLGIYASVLAALVTLFVSGVWHGATLGFIIWGIVMGVCVAVDALFAKKRKKIKNKLPPWLFVFVGIAGTMTINTLILAFTRAGSAGDALLILLRIFDFSGWETGSVGAALYMALLLGIGVTVVSHLLEWKRAAFLACLSKAHTAPRWGVYLILLFAVILFAAGGTNIVGGFIYAQF